ncbi:MAG: ArgE/DapE family deacylase [Desulfobacterales bacterium]|jgi:acetylornithine deacetylase
MGEIQIKRKALLSLLRDLIQIESVNPSLTNKGSGEAVIARYIRDYLNHLGMEVHLQEIEKSRANVVGILKGSGRGPSLMLNGHMDTVSADNMEIDPFAAEEKDGKIYGRGALDMKAGVAALIMAVESIIEAGIKLKGDVILTLVADEEYASIGTETIVDEYTADAAIVCEPTDLDIVIAHKGFAWIKIQIFGHAAHGSLPHKGVDAIVKAGKVLSAIDELSETDLKKKSHPLLGSPSIHASLIEGGTELSTYPNYCKIQLERRNLPGEDRRLVTEEIQGLLQKIQRQDDQFKADYNVFFFRPAFEISPDQPIVQTVSRAYASTLNKPPKFEGMWAWLDSAILAQAGIPTVIFGPRGDGAHAVVEYADVASVMTTTNILIRSTIDFCRT